jgi:catechol-2,3-dioxygenase
MTAPIKLAHVVFRTNQLQNMINWYCDVLSARVVFGNDRIAFLTYDEEHHRIALIATEKFAEKPEGLRVGFYHSAFTFEDLSGLFDNYSRLKAKGILPWRSINHGPTVSQYYRDPDGNDVELQVDRFEDAKAATDWMQGEAFSKNPIGIEFNPDDMIKALAAGRAEADLMKRPDEA